MPDSRRSVGKPVYVQLYVRSAGVTLAVFVSVFKNIWSFLSEMRLEKVLVKEMLSTYTREPSGTDRPPMVL